MTLPVLIIRPQEGAIKTREKAEAMGLRAIVDPIFDIQPVDWQASPTDNFDAIMMTSANAIRYAGRTLQDYIDLPAYVVGEATAAAAVKVGLQIAHIGNAGAQNLADEMAGRDLKRVLRLVGEVYTPIETDYSLENQIVYRAVSLPLGEQAKNALGQGCTVLVHSSRAVATLGAEMDRLEIERGKVHIAAISEKAAQTAGTDWKSINVAEKPTDDALLSAASALCRDNDF